MVRANIDLGNDSAAQTELDKLCSNFSKQERIADAVRYIGDYYNNDLQNPDKAKQLYQYVVDHWPDTEVAMWAQVDIAKSSLDKGDDVTVKADIDKLVTGFSKHKNIARAVHDVAYYCRQTQKHKMANQLDQYVLGHWPTNEIAMWSQVDLVKSDVDNGNDSAAQAGIDKLLANYSDNEHVAKAVHDIAFYYRQIQNREKANQLDQHVVDNWPVDEHAVWAQVDIVKSDIDRGKDNAAQAGIDKLIANFSGQEHIATAVHCLAYYCREAGKHKEADKLDRYVLDSWPSTESGMWAYIDLSIKSNIDSGNLIEAQAGIAQLLADYSDQAYISNAIRTIPLHYRNRGEYKKAKELYQYVMEHWPDGDSAVLAKVDMAVLDISSLISSGRDDEVLPAVDKLIVDFNGNPGLSWSTFTIGEEYYNKAVKLEKEGNEGQAKSYFTKAIAAWEKTIQKLPSSDVTMLACEIIAGYYRQLGEYEKSIYYYQKVIDTHPEYRMAWNALFLTGLNYENMCKSKLILESQANPQIKAIYKLLLDKYPDCKAAKHARYWLGSHSSE